MRIRHEEEIAARELIRAAFHEASHAALIRHFGAYAFPYIWRNEGHEERFQKAWRGKCQIVHQNKTLTKERFSLIGMSGYIGEEIAITKLDGESLVELEKSIGDSFFYAIDDGEISESDLKLIVDDAIEEHVQQAFRLITSYWNDIELEANSMIAQAQTLPPNDLSSLIPTTVGPSMEEEFFDITTVNGGIGEINALFNGSKQN